MMWFWIGMGAVVYSTVTLLALALCRAAALADQMSERTYARERQDRYRDNVIPFAR